MKRNRGLSFSNSDRITLDPEVMGGKPCLRGLRVTVGAVVGLVASGADFAEIVRLYPYLEEADIRAALSYAAGRSKENGSVPAPVFDPGGVG